jgi:hypothetical protein
MTHLSLMLIRSDVQAISTRVGGSHRDAGAPYAGAFREARCAVAIPVARGSNARELIDRGGRVHQRKLGASESLHERSVSSKASGRAAVFPQENQRSGHPREHQQGGDVESLLSGPGTNGLCAVTCQLLQREQAEDEQEVPRPPPKAEGYGQVDHDEEGMSPRRILHRARTRDGDEVHSGRHDVGHCGSTQNQRERHVRGQPSTLIGAS